MNNQSLSVLEKSYIGMAGHQGNQALIYLRRCCLVQSVGIATIGDCLNSEEPTNGEKHGYGSFY